MSMNYFVRLRARRYKFVCESFYADEKFCFVRAFAIETAPVILP